MDLERVLFLERLSGIGKEQMERDLAAVPCALNSACHGCQCQECRDLELLGHKFDVLFFWIYFITTSTKTLLPKNLHTDFFGTLFDSTSTTHLVCVGVESKK